MRFNAFACVLISLVISQLLASRAEAQPEYWLFESDPVRPIALSPDKQRLFVLNTPDGYLQIYSYNSSTGIFEDEWDVPVGLEPVAVAPRNNDEVWVVNHLSDSVSVVNLSQSPPRVIRTLLLGDEPRDIVFGGPGGNRAFITTAHRGQNTDYPDGNFDVPGEGRADVWVFDGSGACSVTTTTECSVDADCPGGETCTRGFGDSLLDTQLEVVTLMGDRPRALAVSPDGSRVYAAVYRSGNRTVPISEGLVCDNFDTNCQVQGVTYPAGRPEPYVGYCDQDITVPCLDDGTPNGTCNGGCNQTTGFCNNVVTEQRACSVAADCQFGSCVSRKTGVIVGGDSATGPWLDENGNDWSAAVKFELPDYDVFELDANAPPPVPPDDEYEFEIGRTSGVGTILFNMLVAPNGDVYVSNTDANNRVRFEGFAEYVSFIGPKPSGDPASVRGNLAKSRVTILDASGDVGATTETEFSVVPRHLNKHIDYDVEEPPAAVKMASVATPLGMAMSDDGSTLYLAAFGSNMVTVYDTTELENDTFDPMTSSVTKIELTGRPTGLVLDDANDRLYIAVRDGFRVFDTTTNTRTQSKKFFNPEPSTVVNGRQFLYDARLTSGNGEASCSSCHIFGDMDDLAWDLGDPDAPAFDNLNPEPDVIANLPPQVNFPDLQPFDPLKGPMTTQSLRGMLRAGPMHWRGDRTAGTGVPLDVNEEEAFKTFNVAFPGLIGRFEGADGGELDTDQMQAFTEFALRLTYPPNPVRNLDNTLTAEQQAGLSLYSGPITDAVSDCEGCHRLDRAEGFFGTGGGSTFEGEAMEFKVPHLRNAYQKVGMFGMAQSNFFPDAAGVDMGPQVRGTGFLHDGSVSEVSDFLSAGVFSTNSTQVDQLSALMIAFETDLAPIVGQQVTLTSTSGPDITDPVTGRLTLLIERAETAFILPSNLSGGLLTTECELVVKGVVAGLQRGWLYNPATSLFEADSNSEPSFNRAQLEALVTPEEPLTFTCVPPGSGERIALNRDGDNFLDLDDGDPDYIEDCSVARDVNTGAPLLFLMLVALLGRFAAAGRRRRRG